MSLTEKRRTLQDLKGMLRETRCECERHRKLSEEAGIRANELRKKVDVLEGEMWREFTEWKDET